MLAYTGDFPDPFVLVIDDTYWAYGTGARGLNLQVMSSVDLRTWSAVADPLPVLPSWAGVGHTWSPAVLRRGSQYVMYYAVRHQASGRQCISVALASSAAGPFRDESSSPLVFQLDRGGSIDPDPFVDVDGTAWLLWKSEENALGRPTHLWVQGLGDDGSSLVGSPSMLLEQRESWQAGVIEGPAIAVIDGAYYLFYGGGRWDSAGAGIGYARGASVAGPFKNASRALPWIASHGDALGPSGPAVFVGLDGVLRLAYHAWHGTVGYERGGVRALWIDELRFEKDRPVLGPSKP